MMMMLRQGFLMHSGRLPRVVVGGGGRFRNVNTTAAAAAAAAAATIGNDFVSLVTKTAAAATTTTRTTATATTTTRDYNNKCSSFGATPATATSSLLFGHDSCLYYSRKLRPSAPPPYHYNNKISTRHFAATAAAKSKNKGNKSKKKKSPSIPYRAGGDAGRVVLHQSGEKKLSSSSGKPKLCSGCGTEIIAGGRSGGGSQIIAGGKSAMSEEAAAERSRKDKKKARYADPFIDGGAGGSSSLLCQRCKQLQQNNIWGAYDALRDVPASVFNAQLAHIVGRRRFGLAIKVIDATDPEFTCVPAIRKSVGGLPLLLVVNKVDLVPRMHKGDLRVIQHRLKNRGINTTAVFGVSAKNRVGIFQLAEALLKDLGGRDVFVIGAANVGKSTLVKVLASTLGEALWFKGPKKAASRRREFLTDPSKLKVTGSHLPGTTLQAVRIPCFSSRNYAMWDTPGIINANAITYKLFPSHLMEPLARPNPIPIPSTERRDLRQLVRSGYSVLIETTWMGQNAKDDDDDDKHDDDDDDVDDEKEDEKYNKNDNNKKLVHHNNSEECCLARLDVASIEDNDVVEIRMYMPPCLSMRVVPTKEAPDHATIPTRYIREVQQNISSHLAGKGGGGGKNNNHANISGLADEYSYPLVPFEAHNNKTGAKSVHVVPTDSEYDPVGMYRMDISFSSLGYLSVSHGSKYSIIPYTVKGAFWSKRRALYPRNLERWLENNDDCIPYGGTSGELRYGYGHDYGEDNAEEHLRRLRDADKEGRQRASRRKVDSHTFDDDFDDGFYY